MNFRFLLLFLILTFSVIQLSGYAQETRENETVKSTCQHAIATDPLLPLFNSFSITYERKQGQKNGLIAGFWYGRAMATYPKEISYPGYSDNYSLILAYRRYFWKNLHAEYQIYPGYTRYYEEVPATSSHGFSLFNEFRIGYRFDLFILKKPLLLNLQWPVGFTLFESNEPESFREVRKKDPVFYIIYPNIWLGFRF